MACIFGEWRLSAMINTIVAEGEDVGTAQCIVNILIRWGISLQPLWQTVNMHDDPSLYVGTCREDFFHAGSMIFC